MLTLIYKKIPQKITLTMIFLGLLAFAPCFAQEQQGNRANSLDNSSGADIGMLKEQARMYCSQGRQMQDAGNIEGAISLYKKATEYDPMYAPAFNDLGVMYEAKGLTDEAEVCYLRAIKVDPEFLGAYSNVAALYETRRDLEKAAYYWEKRVKLGSEGDPWTKKAQQRLDDINIVLGGPGAYRQQEALNLMKDMARRKTILQQSDRAQAREYFESAKRSYKRDDYASALKQAASAQQLDPANSEIEEFIEKVQKRALSR